MENLVLTQVSKSELREMLREEVCRALNAILLEQEKKQKEAEVRYMNIDQLAGYIQRSKSSIRGLVYRMEIPVIRKNRRLIFDRVEIDNWINKGISKTIEQLNQEASDFVRKTS